MALSEAQATLSRLPFRDGDGYSYGGDVVVTIGDRSILLGPGGEAEELGAEIVRRWNARRAALEGQE